MHAVLLERYRESVSLTAWAGSLQTAFMSLGAPLSSFVVDRFSCRTAVMLSGMLFTAGYLGTAFAPNIQTAIFTLGFVAGCGAGVGYTSSMVVIGFNFKRKRHLALGFVLSGMGAGLFALAPLMQLARDYYGSTGFFIIQAAMALNIIAFGATFFPTIGVELFFGGIGAVSGPVFAGILVDIGGTYEQSITFAGISIFLAALLSALTVCFNAPFKYEDVTRIENVVPEPNEGVPLVIGNNHEDITSI
ncbi:monocarboxylate transporter 9-like isoform X2 [Ruditapes philippinarum]|uniref:monocarboxylate transporter 9-like isoform X2 n=1 Tax=Ruditapes philippinarum TaxID=129788 RepID=UPI00295A8DE8|nr:monocarboxylate transporter 9-like isoform X2 [Ruditapes philippinarum]